MKNNQGNVRQTKMVASWETLGSSVPDQGQGGNVIVDGTLAHELLHAIDHGGAQFSGSLFTGLLQTCLYPLESKFLAPALALQQTFGDQ